MFHPNDKPSKDYNIKIANGKIKRITIEIKYMCIVPHNSYRLDLWSNKRSNSWSCVTRTKKGNIFFYLDIFRVKIVIGGTNPVSNISFSRFDFDWIFFSLQFWIFGNLRIIRFQRKEYFIECRSRSHIFSLFMKSILSLVSRKVIIKNTRLFIIHGTHYFVCVSSPIGWLNFFHSVRNSHTQIVNSLKRISCISMLSL